MKKQANVQELLECFDEIPELMSKIKFDHSNKSRFQVLEPNHSYNVAKVLRANESVNMEDPTYLNQVKRMSQQAKKVLQHLQTTSKTPKKSEDTIQRSAELAEKRLKKLQESGVNLTKFYQQYDVHRNGRISYKDFSDTLLALSSGVSREDAMYLAASLDKTKSGALEYKDLVSSLQEVKQNSSDTIKEESKKYKNRPPKKADAQESDSYTASYLQQQSSYQLPYAEYSKSAEAIVNYEPTFTLEALPVEVYEQRKANVYDAGTMELMERVGKRFYYRNPQTNLTATLSKKGAPYYVDPTPEERRIQRKQMRRRSHSEPPALRSMGQHVSKLLNSDALKGDDVDVNNGRHTNSFQRSLRKALFEEQGAGKARTKAATEEDPEPEFLNPLKHIKESAEKKKADTQQIQLRMAENAVASQMNGNISALRHLLNQQDQSRSGYINKEEFQKALKKAGVPIESNSIQMLFRRNAVVFGAGATQDIGLSQGKAVNIENFLDKIQTRTTAPAFAHVTGNSGVIKESKDAEQVRIMKKVLHSLNKLSDPQKLFNDITGHKHSTLSPAELKESLTYAGANLTDLEFNHLIKDIDSNHDGKISLQEFDHYIHDAYNIFDQNNATKLKAQLLESPKYSKSYRSSGIFNDGAEEFHRLDQTKETRQNRRLWERLRQHLQVHHKSVLQSFDSNKLDISKLCCRLKQQGVNLGQEDVYLLRSHIAGDGSKEPEISAVEFCEIVGIPLQYKAGDKLVSIDRAENVSDEGIFASSKRSIASNPIYSSSIFLQTDADLRKNEFGERKKMGTQTLGEHLRTEPSKFWELEKSIANPMLFPQPIPSSRPDFNHSLDLKSLKRGVVSLKDKRMSLSSKLSAHSLAQLGRINSRASDDLNSQLNSERERDRESTSTTNLHSSRRSRSAPPASRSLSQYQEQKKNKSLGTSNSAAAANTSIERPASKLSLSDKISKWSTATLTDYFNNRNSGESTTPTLQRNDSRETTLSPNSPFSPAGSLSGAKDPTNKAIPKFYNGTGRARGTLRKQFDQGFRSPAPYATTDN